MWAQWVAFGLPRTSTASRMAFSIRGVYSLGIFARKSLKLLKGYLPQWTILQTGENGHKRQLTPTPTAAIARATADVRQAPRIPLARCEPRASRCARSALLRRQLYIHGLERRLEHADRIVGIGRTVGRRLTGARRRRLAGGDALAIGRHQRLAVFDENGRLSERNTREHNTRDKQQCR